LDEEIGSSPAERRADEEGERERLVELAVLCDLSGEEIERVEELGEAGPEAAPLVQHRSPHEHWTGVTMPFPDLQKFAGQRRGMERIVPLDRNQPLPTTPQLAPLPELSWESAGWQQAVAPVSGGLRPSSLRGEASLLTVAPIAAAGWAEEDGAAWIETVPGRSMATVAAVRQKTALPSGPLLAEQTQLPQLGEGGHEEGRLAALSAERLQGLIRWVERSEGLLLRLQQVTEQLTQQTAVAEQQVARVGGRRHRRLEARQVKRWHRRGQVQRLRRRRTGEVQQEERGMSRWQGWLDGVSQRVKEKMTRMVAGAAAVTEDPAQDGWSIRAVNGWRRSGRRG
jgi:hypothetical protein